MEKKKKQGRYERIYIQLKDLLTATDDTIARMATVAAVLHHKMDYFFWTGFYLLKNDKLMVGPYQGPVACQILKKNTGVCWSSVNAKESIIVENVEEFPGHIACDSRSKSEIVIPVKNDKNEIIAVLDIDSKDLSSFDETDKTNLEKITDLIFLPI